MRRRVAVTGIGLMSALGTTREAVWNGLVSGQCGIADVRLFDTSGYRSSKAAEIPAYHRDPAFSEKAWRRLLEHAEVPHCGLHAIRHRAATEIANDPTIPLHVGMRLTGHKTVATFARYHHAQRDQVRDAADKVNRQRSKIIAGASGQLVSLGRNQQVSRTKPTEHRREKPTRRGLVGSK